MQMHLNCTDCPNAGGSWNSAETGKVLVKLGRVDHLTYRVFLI